MKDFYYQIKGKGAPGQTGMSCWVWPPIWSGKVSASNKKEAKILIEEEYGRSFPLRVLKKDIESNEFLLHIEEMKEGSHLYKLFQQQTCRQCNSTFYVIDKYNDRNNINKGFDYCTENCKQEARILENFIRNEHEVLTGVALPVIYKITNKLTGLSYIGKTTQVFTLRWYQHFFQSSDSKFHQAIKTCKLPEWQFEIVEIVQIPQDIKQTGEIEKIILDRERYYIDLYDTIKNGYNTL